MNNKTAFNSNIDKDTLKQLQDKLLGNSNIIDELVDELVKNTCSDLDNYISFIQDILKNKDNPPTTLELDDFILNLPVILFWVGDNLENLGIKEDISKAILNEKFNVAYEKANIGKCTISDKTNKAELETQNEYIIKSVYTRAYRKVKQRLETGFELLSSCKKVITRRMNELDINN